MKTTIAFLGLVLMLAFATEQLEIDFDDKPESGVPVEALVHEVVSTDPTSIDFTDKIESVRIRYFNKKTWDSKDGAKEYLAAFLKQKSATAYEFQIWSQSVGEPEVECIVKFSDEHRKKFAEKQTKSYPYGKLLLWRTEGCFRDAEGKWWFVTASDHFHQNHPMGDRSLMKNSEKEK